MYLYADFVPIEPRELKTSFFRWDLLIFEKEILDFFMSLLTVEKNKEEEA